MKNIENLQVTMSQMKKKHFVQLEEFAQRPWKHVMSFQKRRPFKGSFLFLGRVSSKEATLSNPSSNGSYSSTISTFQFEG